MSAGGEERLMWIQRPHLQVQDFVHRRDDRYHVLSLHQSRLISNSTARVTAHCQIQARVQVNQEGRERSEGWDRGISVND